MLQCEASSSVEPMNLLNKDTLGKSKRAYNKLSLTMNIAKTKCIFLREVNYLVLNNDIIGDLIGTCL